MPTTYAKPDPNDTIHEMVRAAILRWHPRLSEARVAIDLLFAHGAVDRQGNPIGYPLKKNGVGALGLARIVNLRDRAKGNGDAEITIDGDRWLKMGSDRRMAVLDHELTHIQLKTHEDGEVKTDDLKRPVLGMRPHDVEVGWFGEVAERHGLASIEVLQARTLIDDRGQTYFPFLEVTHVSPELVIAARNGDLAAAQRAVEEHAKKKAKGSQRETNA